MTLDGRTSAGACLPTPGWLCRGRRNGTWLPNPNALGWDRSGVGPPIPSEQNRYMSGVLLSRLGGDLRLSGS